MHRTSSETNSQPRLLQKPSVKTFRWRALRRLTRLNLGWVRSAAPRPTPANATGEFRPVVAANRQRPFALSHDRVQHARHLWRGGARLLPTRNTPVCRHPSRSGVKPLIHTTLHHARNTTPTPDSPPSAQPVACATAHRFVFPVAINRIAIPIRPKPALASTWSAASPRPPAGLRTPVVSAPSGGDFELPRCFGELCSLKVWHSPSPP
jgi:hypothetical protein